MFSLFKWVFLFLLARLWAFGAARYATEETEDKYSSVAELQNLQLDYTITPGAEAANVVNVAFVVKSDKNQNTLAVPSVIDFYFSDASTGLGYVATAPSGAVAIGTNGSLIDLTGAKKVFRGITTAAGLLDINITEAGAKTLYVVVIAPNQRIIPSAACTWT